MNLLKEKILQNFKIVVIAFFLSVGVNAVYGAWSPPPGSPTNCPTNYPGCDAPLHLGGDGQIKQGGLTVGYGLDASQPSLLVLKGKAGIGTIEPTQMLDVVGYSKSRTGFCINDSCITSFSWATGGDNVVELPSGTVLPFNLSSCPSGWSPFTDGAGRVILGVGNSNTGSGSTASTNHTLGQKGGQEAIVQTLEQMASHNHTINNNGNYLVNAFGNTGKNYCSGGTCQQNVDIPWDNPNTSSPSIGATGNAEAMNMLNPYIALLYCVKN